MIAPSRAHSWPWVAACSGWVCCGVRSATMRAAALRQTASPVQMTRAARAMVVVPFVRAEPGPAGAGGRWAAGPGVVTAWLPVWTTRWQPGGVSGWWRDAAQGSLGGYVAGCFQQCQQPVRPCDRAGGVQGDPACFAQGDGDGDGAAHGASPGRNRLRTSRGARGSSMGLTMPAASVPNLTYSWPGTAAGS